MAFLSKPENAGASLAPIQIKTTPVPLSRLCNEKLGRKFFCLNFSICPILHLVEIGRGRIPRLKRLEIKR